MGKSKNRIAQKEKAAKNLVKNSSKTAGIKKRRVNDGLAITTYREARSNSRSARKKNKTHKNSTLLQKLKELAAEADNYEEIVSDLIPQANSDNNNKSRDHIITNSTVILVLIYQTGYKSPMIVYSLAIFPWKKDW